MALFDLYGFASDVGKTTSSWLDFTPIVDTISGGFTWLKDNPEAAAALGGAAAAGLGYLQNRENIEAAERAAQKEREYRGTFGGASTVDPNVYSAGLQTTQQAPTGIATGGGIAGTGQVGTVGQQPTTMSGAVQLRDFRQGLS